jgi:hypothetical protein
MSIIQISKIQQRAGDLVDLPQLDEAEFGFATDERRLFIGKTTGNIENIEVLTAYSEISFDQIEGVNGNISIDSSTLANGQVLVYDGNNWVNGGFVNLGNVTNVSIEGGAIGYVLTTDGSGGLSWSPKGIVAQNIETISAANPGRITLSQPYPFAQGVEVTINGITGAGGFATNLNGNVFFLKTVPGNLQLYDLYTDSGLVSGENTSGYGVYPTDSGIVIFNTVTANGGLVAGTTYSVQYNSGTDFAGDSNFTWNYNTNQLTIVGNANLQTTVTTAITTGGNTTAGTITGNWTLTSGSRLTATYADLAEYYSADKAYLPGTVLEFGGEKEVTIAGIETNKLAGVVSTNPSYVMNGDLRTQFPVILALVGRIPVKVIGKVSKGDMLVSAGNGLAKVVTGTPKIGTVIGKAIENKVDDGDGFVEVMVGRI